MDKGTHWIGLTHELSPHPAISLSLLFYNLLHDGIELPLWFNQRFVFFFEDDFVRTGCWADASNIGDNLSHRQLMIP